MKRVIKAAEGDSQIDMFEDALDSIKDDFDYAVDGLEKLANDGYQADAKELAEELRAAINNTVTKISAIIAQ